MNDILVIYDRLAGSTDRMLGLWQPKFDPKLYVPDSAAGTSNNKTDFSSVNKEPITFYSIGIMKFLFTSSFSKAALRNFECPQ